MLRVIFPNALWEEAQYYRKESSQKEQFGDHEHVIE